LIVNGYKDIENRSRRTHIRERILVHASASNEDFKENCAYVKRHHRITVPDDVDFGGIIGVVDLVDCVRRSASPWHNIGSWGWVLASPRQLRFRACKGSLGFFTPDFDR
jgi:hypothetical protein